MFDSSRRNFLRQTSLGLAATGVSGLVLCSHARPTQEVNRDGSNDVVIQMGPAQQEVAPKTELKKTTPQPYGPCYRTGAPFLRPEPGQKSSSAFVLSVHRPKVGVLQ